jgi:hypothetical protein
MMAERHNAPSQSDQASDRAKAEGERDTSRDAPGRDPLRTGRGGLDPIELRDVRDETSERHRRGEDVGASGESNPTLAEQQEEEAEQPPAKTPKSATAGGRGGLDRG